MCNIARSLAHALVSVALSVTALCSPCTEVEGVVSTAFDKEEMLVVVCGATSAGQKPFVFWVSTQSFPKSVLGNEASAPGSRFGPMAFCEQLTLKCVEA